MNKHDVLRGMKHIEMLTRSDNLHREETAPYLSNNSNDLRILGTALSALFEASTCHRGCNGGPHILEALAGRTYNLACSSISLIFIGYYDEAMVMVRSIGEITNLLSLSVYNEKKWHEWLHSDKEIRLKKFTPAKVRNLIGPNQIIPMKKDWYSNLCESYVHPTPGTKPNQHNENGRGVVGGIVQEKGITETLGHLTFITCAASGFFCRFFDFNDLLDSMADHLEKTYDLNKNGSPVELKDKPAKP